MLRNIESRSDCEEEMGRNSRPLQNGKGKAEHKRERVLLRHPSVQTTCSGSYWCTVVCTLVRLCKEVHQQLILMPSTNTQEKMKTAHSLCCNQHRDDEGRVRGGVKRGGLQCRNSHVGFLWADLGSWCLDKASDFPARNVHSPRETANHRKGEKERKRVRQTERGRERERRSKRQQRQEKERKK
uniref:Uncharacterized protein n=1 Tax=Astatotilapia calliptera TaxID=8154 RepID=A0AAX7SG18_ASTCA